MDEIDGHIKQVFAFLDARLDEPIPVSDMTTAPGDLPEWRPGRS